MDSTTNGGIIPDSINEDILTVNREWRITSFNALSGWINGVLCYEDMGRRCAMVKR